MTSKVSIVELHKMKMILVTTYHAMNLTSITSAMTFVLIVSSNRVENLAVKANALVARILSQEMPAPTMSFVNTSVLVTAADGTAMMAPIVWKVRIWTVNFVTQIAHLTTRMQTVKLVLMTIVTMMTIQTMSLEEVFAPMASTQSLV